MDHYGGSHFTLKTMKGIYTAVVKSSLTYAATVWLNGLSKTGLPSKLLGLLDLYNFMYEMIPGGTLKSQPTALVCGS